MIPKKGRYYKCTKLPFAEDNLFTCGDNYHKLMEKVLQARFKIFDFISKSVPHEVKTGINLERMNSETSDSREFDINLDNFKGFSCSIQNNSLSLYIKL